MVTFPAAEHNHPLASTKLYCLVTEERVCTTCPESHTHTCHFTALFQVYLGELVLSQRRDLLEQSLDFYEPDVLPATQPIMSKHYRKTQWFGCLCFIDNLHRVRHLTLRLAQHVCRRFVLSAERCML